MLQTFGCRFSAHAGHFSAAFQAAAMVHDAINHVYGGQWVFKYLLHWEKIGLVERVQPHPQPGGDRRQHHRHQDEQERDALQSGEAQ